MRDTTLLITGFGPFPGTPENPSSWLAERLAALPDRLGHECRVHGHVWPTEWDAVATRISSLLDARQPDIVLHFGVSRRARGFRIERNAFNRTSSRIDASGRRPNADGIMEDGPACLSSAFPTRELVRHLKTSGWPATASSNAGDYLCNFLYYHSLAWASSRDRKSDVVFVHIPPTTILSESRLLAGAQAIVEFALRNRSATLAMSQANIDPAPVRGEAARGNLA